MLYNFKINHIQYMMIFINNKLINFNKKYFNHKFRLLVLRNYYKRKIKMTKIIRLSYWLIYLKIIWCLNKLIFKQIKKEMFISQVILSWVGSMKSLLMMEISAKLLYGKESLLFLMIKIYKKYWKIFTNRK